jgi:inosine-uridine nucleoside N-ribohydrolase
VSAIPTPITTRTLPALSTPPSAWPWWESDVTIGIRFTGDDLDRLATATGPAGVLLSRALPYYVAFHQAQFGPRTCCAHDAVAAAVLTDPGLVTGWAHGEVAVVERDRRSRAVLRPQPEGRSRAVATMDGRALLDRLVVILAP